MIETVSKYRVGLFDVDGVLLLARKFFSHHYADERGLDKKAFDDFFKSTVDDVLRGKTTYKDQIVKHNDLWQWDRDPEELLDIWFKFENNLNLELIDFLKKLRSDKFLIFLATNQDKYRAIYLKKLYADIIDGAFVSSDFGYIKEEPEFFQQVIRDLQKRLKSLEPRQIVFFDDDPVNIKAAKAQGISAFLYKNPKHVKKILKS